MKLLRRLFILYFICCATSLFGQTAEPTFAYKQDSIFELLTDSNWIKTNAERYRTILEAKYVDKKIDTIMYWVKKMDLDVVLNEYNEGLAITDRLLETSHDLLVGKAFFTVFQAYFEQSAKQNRAAYIPAVKAAFKKAKATDFDWFEMKNIMTPDDEYGGYIIMNYFHKDQNKIQKYFKDYIQSFKSGGGSFSFAEMGSVIRVLAYLKISNSVNEENGKLIKEISSSQTNGHKDVVKDIDESLTAVFPGNEPGAAIVLMKDDQIFLQKGYGLADIHTKVQIDIHTNFNIASISKMFTATAILLLKQENKLSLQDPIIKYLPDVNPKIGNRIKIYHLLTHSSGLPRYIPIKDSVLALTAMDRDTYEFDKNIDTLSFEPGTKFSYSNIGYRWLSLIVERVSGRKFSDFVRERILLPAKMNNSYELNRDMPIPYFAHAYKWKNRKFVECDYGEEPLFSTLGDGGIVTNVTDMVEWEKALRTNRVLSKDLINESIAPQINSDIDNPNIHYGYGWEMETSAEHKTEYSHSGGNGAFISYFLRVPDKNLMYAIFMNRDDKSDIYNYIKETIKNAKWY
jgi:CubicO group peptidase (beta-lactamase class C family)